MRFFIVDVFCKGKYSGNQLAVVCSAESLSPAEMQAIAVEFHFSETSFIVGRGEEDGSWRVRIFTPRNEVPFAGHPSLGTAFVIRNELQKRKSAKVALAMRLGKIPVSFDDDNDIAWMRQVEPVFGTTHSREPMAGLLGIPVEEVDERFPVQSVSTGMEFVLVPVNDLRTLRNASVDPVKYGEYFAGKDPRPVFIFSPETYEQENSISCRMFADAFGIPEDPATGSANGCLAAYLSRYRYCGSSAVDISVEQGYELGRKSILHIRAGLEGDTYGIEVGGRVVKTAEGMLV